MTVCHSVTDWGATGAMLQGIGTIAGAITVLIAALVGAQTFKGWKQQTIAQRRNTEAEKILTSTYKIRRQLARVRSPMMWAHETDTAQEQLEQDGQWGRARDEEDRKGLAYLKAYYNRLKSTESDQSELDSCLPMARAIFGEELESALETLNHQFWTVKIYADAYYRDRNTADREFRNKIESTIWSGFSPNGSNEVDDTINDQIKIVERICLPALRLEVKPAKRFRKEAPSP